MKRIKSEKLQPGDIILTASRTKAGKTVRIATGGDVSHAMICVQHSSIIDSTSHGVQAWNLQRMFFEDDEGVFGFRLRESLSPVLMAQAIDFARSQIGTRYSTTEAIRSVTGGRKPRSQQQFCSRLVARMYASVGVQLVADKDYCTPEDLRRSPLLEELPDLTEIVTDEDVEQWRSRADPIQMQHDAQNAILAVARRLDPQIENFTDVDRLVREHPEFDAMIAQAYRDSGYLDLWQHELSANPWRYNLELMESITDPAELADLRVACIETIREAYSGGKRFAVNLAYYEAAHSQNPRETLTLLISLYETLVRNDHQWRETARAWLLRHHPEDVDRYMERIVPHSDLWFLAVDRVEPLLGVIARMSIEQEGSVEVCSSCGDAARDYRIANADEAMPGVPSLRLCEDCVAIRRSSGEKLEPLVSG